MPSNRELLASMPESPNATVTACQRWVLDNGPALRLALERGIEADRLNERVAVLTAHRACCGTEHDPANGKLHGYCVVCGVPWPCEYAGSPAKIDAYFAEGEKPDNYPHEHECGSCGVHWECRSMGCAFNYLANCDPGTGCNQLRTNH